MNAKQTKRHCKRILEISEQDDDQVEDKRLRTVHTHFCHDDDSNNFLAPNNKRCLLKRNEVVRNVSLTLPDTATLSVIEKEDSVAYNSDNVYSRHQKVIITSDDEISDPDDDDDTEGRIGIVRKNKYFAEYTKSNPTHLPDTTVGNTVVYNEHVLTRYVPFFLYNGGYIF